MTEASASSPQTSKEGRSTVTVPCAAAPAGPPAVPSRMGSEASAGRALWPTRLCRCNDHRALEWKLRINGIDFISGDGRSGRKQTLTSSRKLERPRGAVAVVAQVQGMHGGVRLNGQPFGALVQGPPLQAIWYCAEPDVWQQTTRSQIIEAHITAREVIPQPKPRPSLSQEIRRRRQSAP